MALLDMTLSVVERMLNHIRGGSFGSIVFVYQKYDFMLEMRNAANQWETFVQLVLNGDVGVGEHPL
jgi:hypothetical protein